MERRTLPGPDYHDPAVFELERERIFLRSWFLAGRAEQAATPGDWFTVDVVGESVIVMRGDDSELRAFYNVCSHRGARLRDEPSGHEHGALACPYHAWCYKFSGELTTTPRVGKDEVNRAAHGLSPVHLDVWQGFVFVNLDRQTPTPVRDYLAANFDDVLAFERFDLESLRIGATRSWTIEANWKIVVENYCECLHCPTVHPELVEVIPAYRTGWVLQDDRDDGGVSIVGNSYAAPGTATIAVLPTMTEEESQSVYGGTIFPNALIDIAGTGVVVTQLVPVGPTTTIDNAWYLFHPDSIAADDFDPSGVIDFCDLVVRQDNAVCERVQRGVRSRSFEEGGVYPEKDQYVWEFNQRYLGVRDRSL